MRVPVGNNFCTYSRWFQGLANCFVVPEVVPTILHFGDIVAMLILAKNVLFSFVRKIHKVTPTHYFDITAIFISYLPNGWINLLMNHCIRIDRHRHRQYILRTQDWKLNRPSRTVHAQPQSHTNYTNTRDRVLCGLDSIFSVFSRECLSC